MLNIQLAQRLVPFRSKAYRNHRFWNSRHSGCILTLARSFPESRRGRMCSRKNSRLQRAEHSVSDAAIVEMAIGLTVSDGRDCPYDETDVLGCRNIL